MKAVCLAVGLSAHAAGCATYSENGLMSSIRGAIKMSG